jgi:hypothetical protein
MLRNEQSGVFLCGPLRLSACSALNSVYRRERKDTQGRRDIAWMYYALNE